MPNIFRLIFENAMKCRGSGWNEFVYLALSMFHCYFLGRWWILNNGIYPAILLHIVPVLIYRERAFQSVALWKADWILPLSSVCPVKGLALKSSTCVFYRLPFSFELHLSSFHSHLWTLWHNLDAFFKCKIAPIQLFYNRFSMSSLPTSELSKYRTTCLPFTAHLRVILWH